MMEKPIWVRQKSPRILPTGYKDFDDYFKILSGTCTIFYVCNQTYWDPIGIWCHWATNLFDDEFNITVSTRSDPVTAVKMAFKIDPKIIKRNSLFSREGRAYWIDMYSGKGLKEGIKEDVIEEYIGELKQFEIDVFSLYLVKNPEKSSSIGELDSFIEEITGRVSMETTGRIIITRGDDLLDAWKNEFLKFFRNHVDLILHKFQHTGIYIFSYKNYPRKFHTAIEKIADNIILWEYDIEKEEKYMQILKSSVIDSFFGKVPYRINEKMLPEFKLP